MLMSNSDMICMRKRRVGGLAAAPAALRRRAFLLSAVDPPAEGQIFSVNKRCWSASDGAGGVRGVRVPQPTAGGRPPASARANRVSASGCVTSQPRRLRLQSPSQTGGGGVGGASASGWN